MGSFRYALRKFLRFSNDLLAAKASLTPEQYEALLALKSFASEAGMLVGQLSERLQVRHHTTVALTNKLVARNLVTKKRSATDRRQVYVQLTAAGDALLEAVASVHRKAIRVHSTELIAVLRQLQK